MGAWKIKKAGGLGIGEADTSLGVEHENAAGERVEDPSERLAHGFVLREAGVQGQVAFRELLAEVAHLSLQVAIGDLQPGGGGDEVGEGLRQQMRGRVADCWLEADEK